MLLVQMVKGAQEWLLALPELSCGGFRAFLNEVHKKSFLVFPNGCAVVLKQEADNCWSLERLMCIFEQMVRYVLV